MFTYNAQYRKAKEKNAPVFDVVINIDFSECSEDEIKTLAAKYIAAKVHGDWQKTNHPNTMNAQAKNFLVRKPRTVDPMSALKQLTMEQLLAFCKERGLDLSPNAQG